MRRPFGPTIAERHLVSRDREAARVRVSLGTPRWNGSEWECPFRIRSAGGSEVDFGRGLDSMQALTTAVEGIRVALESKFGALSWEGVFPHHSGFQRAIPLSLRAVSTILRQPGSAIYCSNSTMRVSTVD